jgi:hypothetical protein
MRLVSLYAVLFPPVSIFLQGFHIHLTARFQEVSCCAIKLARLKRTIFHKRVCGDSAHPSGERTYIFGQLQFLNGV